MNVPRYRPKTIAMTATMPSMVSATITAVDERRRCGLPTRAGAL